MDGTVDIPEGAASPVLSYYNLFDYDDAVFLVDVTTDERQSWTNIYFEEGWEPDWEQNVISLDGYQGETISVRFRVVGGEELFETWRIDDVRIGEEEGAYTLPGRKAVFKLIDAPLLQSEMVTVTVEDTEGASQVGLPVYVFDGTTYTGLNGTTDQDGQVTFSLEAGSYRFRADLNGTQFWSGEVNHCTVPGCVSASITVTLPVTVTVEDTNGTPKEGLPVYAFDGTTYTGYNGTTDIDGEVEFTLPMGDYRFRSDLNGTQFWSGEINHCAIPGCEGATVVVTLPVTVYVENTDTVPQEGLPVYVFDEATYTGFHGSTDANGEVQFTLPQGDYHFRSDLNGTQFWSGAANHCTIPGCLNASITVTIPMTVTVQSQTGSPYPDLHVYVFSGESYTGFNGTSDENGQVVFTLPVGDYRFRADYDGVQFWSGDVDHCTIPGCLEALVEIPGGVGEVSVTIDYIYDPLYRLTDADYTHTGTGSTGEYFWYTYDAVGNRLMQETHEGTNIYTYDIANRLVEVDGVAYTWDANGNLLVDGVSTYTYDHANRLTSVVQGGDPYTFTYNGLGDRLQQTVNGIPTSYTLDLNVGLTQVLEDGESDYLYGLGRIGEQQPAGWAYHMPDALNSVRQLTDASVSVTLAQSYEPFGNVMASSGSAETSYSFTGEWADGTGLMHLRARYYAPMQGRFLSRDTWNGNSNIPMSFNAWLYVNANPMNFSDPSGSIPRPWHPPITVCVHCYLIEDPEARRICFEECLCGLLDSQDDAPCPGCTYLGDFNLSAYYAPLESEFGESNTIVPATEKYAKLYGKYLAEDCSNTVTGLCYINNEDYALYANDKFLYRSDAICTQGMGRVRDGRYISCTIPVTWEGMPSSRDNILFEWKGDPGKHVAFKTAARNPGNFDLKDKKIYIPELVTVLHMEGLDHPNLDGFFTVNDIGGKLDIDTIDIYIGEGQQIYDKFYFIVRGIENTPVYIRP